MKTVSVLTQHNDVARSGANLLETTLNVSNVNVNQFGKLFSYLVVGKIFAQPLYVPNVKFADGSVHNAVFVATMENWVYAFDADGVGGTGGAPLWAHQVDKRPPVPATIFRPGYSDVRGNIGILGTPVIDAHIGTSAADPSTGTLYFILATWDQVTFNQDPQKAFKQFLYALDLATGKPRALPGGAANPVEIVGEVAGQGYLGTDRHDEVSNKPLRANVRVDGAQNIVFDGKVGGKTVAIVDGRHDPGGDRVIFNPMQQMQRPGLLLSGGNIFIAFGSHGDFDPYHGWIFAYDALTLRQKGVFCTTPNGAQGGVWQAGEGLVADDAGCVFAGTGNGDFHENPGGSPDLGECFIKLRLVEDSGGSRLELVGWLNAFREDLQLDEDLGAASPTLLPNGHMVGGGKDGRFYVLDSSLMDLHGNANSLRQKFAASSGPESLPNFTHHIHGSPVTFVSPEHGLLVYVFGENDVLRAYQYDPATNAFPGQPGPEGGQGVPLARGTAQASNDRQSNEGMPGGMLSISANGQGPAGGAIPGSGIVWASFPPYDNANLQTVLGELRAFDASRIDAQGRLVTIWSSRFNPQRDHYGNFPKFCCPTIANGRIYQATFNTPGELVVYGLLPSASGGYDLGFGGTSGLTLNGGCRVDHGHIRLTELPHLFVASSVFASNPVAIAQFRTIFRFQLVGAVADGFTFTIQGEGPLALGSPGGGLGYGPDPNAAQGLGYRITRSVTLAFDLWDNQTGNLRESIGMYVDGASPSGAEHDLPPNFLRSGHILRATLVYDGTNLVATLLDETTRATVTETFPVDIPSHVQGPNAYVGFTAATGGASARQDILSWQFQ